MKTGETTFYPSMVVNLRLRFDETLQVAPSQVALAQAAANGELDSRGGKADRPATGQPRRRRVRLGNLTVESASGTSTVDADPVNRSWHGLEPLVTPADPMTVLMNRVPRRGSLNLPSPRQAAEFSFEFDYRDLPIDPRIVRGVGVEVHLGCVSAADYARGMKGERDESGRLLSILRTRSDLIDPFTGRPDVALQTLVFYGTVDEWEANHDEGSSVVSMVGRDVRGIFLDAKIPVGQVREVRLEQPIDRVVADILATLPTQFDLVIDVFTDRSEWPNGVVPSPVDRAGLTRLNLDASGAGESKPPGGSKLSYWDLITQYCNLVGAIPYWRGTALWIRPARSIFQTLTDRRLPTPFRGGRPRRVGVTMDDDGTFRPTDEVRVRRLVHGRHVKKLSMKRKFGGVTVPAVECVSIDDSVRGREALITARWPPADSVAGALKDDSDVQRIPIPGCRDRDRLLAIARDVYEEIGRGEIGGQVETNFLASFGGDDEDPDLLTLRPADPLEIVVDIEKLSSRAPIIDELVRHQSRTFHQEIEELTRHLGDPVLARVLVASSRRAIVGQLDVFRISGIRYDFDRGAIRIAAEFHNYVVARHAEASLESSKEREVKRSRVKVKGKSKPVTPVTIQPSAAALSSVAAIPIPGNSIPRAINVGPFRSNRGSLGTVYERTGVEHAVDAAIRRSRGEEDLNRALKRRGVRIGRAYAGDDPGGDE